MADQNLFGVMLTIGNLYISLLFLTKNANESPGPSQRPLLVPEPFGKAIMAEAQGHQPHKVVVSAFN